MLSDFLDVYGPTYFMSLHDSRQRIACHFGESRVLNRDVHAGLGWHHLGSDWYDAQGGWLVGDDLKLDQAERFGHRRNEFELCIGHQGDKALNGMSMIQLCHPLCFEEVSGSFQSLSLVVPWVAACRFVCACSALPSSEAGVDLESGNLPLQDPPQNASKCNGSGVQNQVLCVSPPVEG